MTSVNNFAKRLAQYKQLIDDDIVAYAAYIRKSTREQYGRYPVEVEIDIFLDMLSRGGKRLRGALVMEAYKMCGGTDQKMIIQAARAIEMLHAYILMIDDIQDHSDLRRGKPTAHVMLADYHRKHKLKGSPEHAGIALGLMAAVAGAHAAEAVLANLDADPQLRLNALSIVNRTMLITAHGQTYDIMNELLPQPLEEYVDKVLEWKSGLYSVTNPIHVGMVLAGAGCEHTDAITPYSQHAGKAFQITDDILGIYGDQKTTGKSVGDDIREGKATVISLYALKHASPADKQKLQRCLGNPKLTTKDLEDCKKIIQDCGALDYARNLAAQHTAQAIESLDAVKDMWPKQGTDFLRGLAQALQNRKS